MAASPQVTLARRPSPPLAFGGTLGVIALAFGVGMLGAYMLDLHGHTCEACGSKWRHFGAFSVGDPGAHACRKCGTVQWWKDGVPNVFREALRTPPPDPLEARLRKIRESSHQALLSGTRTAGPR